MAEGSLSAEIEELDIPTAPGAAGWGDFCRAVEIGNVVDAERFGTPASQSRRALCSAWADGRTAYWCSLV